VDFPILISIHIDRAFLNILTEFTTKVAALDSIFGIGFRVDLSGTTETAQYFHERFRLEVNQHRSDLNRPVCNVTDGASE
jgi:hypothetical protein